MKWHVIKAVFWRNFVSYFSSPTGYVFICLFVLLSAIAAFWPNEFFNANLANLDQLNRYFPYIMLVFIPAITMSVWADERRQGTDELLLTIPASDLEVVVGKYLAAVGIFTASLLFSVFNIGVLMVLGVPDLGLLMATYLGYWLVGLAMLAIGSAASFLTSNLTVAFILGVVFNLPLVFANAADTITGAEGALAIKSWSIGEQFRDFGRGVASLSGLAYFAMIVIAMLYLSMVLIGRRHWAGGKDGESRGAHYLVRTLALVGLGVGLALLLNRNDVRFDLTNEKLSSLTAKSSELVKGVQDDRPVRIEAFVSPQVPESYVQTRLNLLTALDEIEALGRGKIRVKIHPTEQLTATAARAEEEFGIQGREVASRNRGAMNVEQVYMGLAVLCGLEKVVIPFIDRGIPVEYELVRSIATVSQQQRKTCGVLTTDAKLYGGFDMATMASSQNEQIIEELEKQYEVVQVNADAPITRKFDVLLAVQPSSLTQPQMDNFLAAVKSGQPTAVFEDPFPYIDGRVPGTSQPKQPAGGGNPFMNQGPPQPKGDISPLWQMLGVSFEPRQVVWQGYNPYPKIMQFPQEFVFVDQGQRGTSEPFSTKSEATSKLQQLMFLFPGAIQRLHSAGLEYVPLVRTGTDTGEVAVDEILEPGLFGRGGNLNARRNHRTTREEYHLAVMVQGKPKDGNESMSDDGLELAQADAPAAEPAASADNPLAGLPEDLSKVPEKTPEAAEIKVAVVADIDLFYSAFFRLRQQGADPDAEVHLDLDNVTFVLNLLDVLSGDERFVSIRSRRPAHRTLTSIEQWTEEARDQANTARDDFVKKFSSDQEKEQAKLDEELAKIRESSEDERTKMMKLQLVEDTGRQRLEATVDRLKKELDREKKQIDRTLALSVRKVQDRVKFGAVMFPPILPLVLGVLVYFNRRAREHEGVSKNRLR